MGHVRGVMEWNYWINAYMWLMSMILIGGRWTCIHSNMSHTISMEGIQEKKYNWSLLRLVMSSWILSFSFDCNFICNNILIYVFIVDLPGTYLRLHVGIIWKYTTVCKSCSCGSLERWEIYNMHGYISYWNYLISGRFCRKIHSSTTKRDSESISSLKGGQHNSPYHL